MDPTPFLQSSKGRSDFTGAGLSGDGAVAARGGGGVQRSMPGAGAGSGGAPLRGPLRHADIEEGPSSDVVLPLTSGSFISVEADAIRWIKRNHQKAIPFGRIVGAEAVRPTLTKRQCRRAETAAGQRIAAEAKAAKAAGIATSSRAGTAQAPNSTTALTKDVDTNHINNSSNGEVGSAASGNDGAVAPTIAASSVTATGSRTALSSAATSPDKARGSSKPLSQKQLYIQQEKDLLLQDVASKGPIVLRVAELYEPKRIIAGPEYNVERRLRVHEFPCACGLDLVERAVMIIRLLTLGSEKRARRVRVIMNPHSGAGIATAIFETRIAPIFDFAGLRYDVTATDHAGHAIEIGRDYDPKRYEGCMFISGDGTVQEFVSGLLTRKDWRTLVRRVPICTVACGTANALAVGLRTVNPEYAALCVVKHRLRPLDAILVSNGAGLRTVSLCGVGWGIAADIAANSEAYRWMKTMRYDYLKAKFGISIFLGLTVHKATLEYSADVAMDDVALAAYFAQPIASGRQQVGGRTYITQGGQEDPAAAAAFRQELLAHAASAPPLHLHSKKSMADLPPGVLQAALLQANNHNGNNNSDILNGTPQRHIGGSGGRLPGSAAPSSSAVFDQQHFRRSSMVVNPEERVARLRVSRSALEMYTAADPSEVEKAYRDAAAMTGGLPVKSGVGRILGRDSMDLGAVAERLRAEQAAEETAAAGGGGGGVAVGVPLPKEATSPSLGGITNISAPTAAVVAEMEREKEKLTQQQQQPGAGAGAAAGGGDRKSNTAGDGHGLDAISKDPSLARKQEVSDLEAASREGVRGMKDRDAPSATHPGGETGLLAHMREVVQQEAAVDAAIVHTHPNASSSSLLPDTVSAVAAGGGDATGNGVEMTGGCGGGIGGSDGRRMPTGQHSGERRNTDEIGDLVGPDGSIAGIVQAASTPSQPHLRGALLRRIDPVSQPTMGSMFSERSISTTGGGGLVSQGSASSILYPSAPASRPQYPSSSMPAAGPDKRLGVVPEYGSRPTAINGASYASGPACPGVTASAASAPCPPPPMAGATIDECGRAHVNPHYERDTEAEGVEAGHRLLRGDDQQTGEVAAARRRTHLLNTSSSAAAREALPGKPRPGHGGFGQLTTCRRNCNVCRTQGRMRYLGHWREAVILDACEPETPPAAQRGRPVELAMASDQDESYRPHHRGSDADARGRRSSSAGTSASAYNACHNVDHSRIDDGGDAGGAGRPSYPENVYISSRPETTAEAEERLRLASASETGAAAGRGVPKPSLAAASTLGGSIRSGFSSLRVDVPSAPPSIPDQPAKEHAANLLGDGPISDAQASAAAAGVVTTPGGHHEAPHLCHPKRGLIQTYSTEGSWATPLPRPPSVNNKTRTFSRGLSGLGPGPAAGADGAGSAVHDGDFPIAAGESRTPMKYGSHTPQHMYTRSDPRAASIGSQRPRISLLKPSQDAIPEVGTDSVATPSASSRALNSTRPAAATGASARSLAAGSGNGPRRPPSTAARQLGGIAGVIGSLTPKALFSQQHQQQQQQQGRSTRFPSRDATASTEGDTIIAAPIDAAPVQHQHIAAAGPIGRVGRSLSALIGFGNGAGVYRRPTGPEPPHVWQNLDLRSESASAGGDHQRQAFPSRSPSPRADTADTGPAAAGTGLGREPRIVAPTDSAPVAAPGGIEAGQAKRSPYSTVDASAAAAEASEEAPQHHRHTISVTNRGFEKRREHGRYVTVATVTAGRDGPYVHPSDGYLDLIIARSGSVISTMGLLLRYVGHTCAVSDEKNSPLYDYVKARSVVLTPDADQGVSCCNVDGEVLPGPGPFRMHLMPSLLTAYGEY